MRVIAGIAKGKKLRAPNSRGVRPTPDRVREALFSSLAPDLPGARVLDLFSGTGALGIEAVSRGAAHATFVEKDRNSLIWLNKNLEVLSQSVSKGQLRVLSLPVQKALGVLHRENEEYDLVFLDPPYDAQLLVPTCEDLAQRGLVTRLGLAVCEHSQLMAPPVPPVGWRSLQTRTYGGVAVTILRNEPLEEANGNAECQ